MGGPRHYEFRPLLIPAGAEVAVTEAVEVQGHHRMIRLGRSEPQAGSSVRQRCFQMTSMRLVSLCRHERSHSVRDELTSARIIFGPQNSGLPVNRVNKVSSANSSEELLVQLADLVAGAARRATERDRSPLDQIDDKLISLQVWPPSE
jgi:hypothetical protein